MTNIIHHFDAEIELIPNIAFSRSKDDPRPIIISRMVEARVCPAADCPSLSPIARLFSSLLISVKNKQIFYIFCRDFDLCKVLTVVEVSGSSCSSYISC